MSNKEKGITLVALVITVIVLLILSGVALSMIAPNDNTIFKYATNARDDYKNASQEEKDKTDELVRMMENVTATPAPTSTP